MLPSRTFHSRKSSGATWWSLRDRNCDPKNWEHSRSVVSRASSLGDGLAINLLSPVIISFYLSVVPTFIPAGASRLYYPLLASSHVTMAFLCHSAWATGLDAMRRWFIRPWTRRVLQTATGLALIGLSARVIL